MSRQDHIPSGLIAYVVLLFAVPSALTVPALGGAGSPARIVGLLLMGWWAYDHIQQSRRAPNAVQAAYFVFLGAVLASYVAATTRAIPIEEVSTATLGIVLVLSFGGSLLIASNGLTSMDAITRMLRMVVVAGAAVAAFACFQVVTHREWADMIHLPGLSANTPIYQLGNRDGLPRPNGTATHPIELGMVLTMVLPIAINLAITDRSRTTLRRLAPVVLILAAIFLSISRSAMVGAVLGLIVIAVRWTPEVRHRAALAAPVFGFGVFVMVPGLLGTIAGLFTGAGNDDSVRSRTDSYALAWSFIHHAPWFGRGLGTFLPEYRILDNQWLGLLIEIGLVGTLCFAVLILTALHAAESARRARAGTGSDQLAQGVKASVAVGAVCLLFFDGFSFPIGSGLLFLMIGIAGSLGRLTAAARRPERHPRLPQVAPLPLPLRALGPAILRRWYVTVPGIALSLFVAMGTLSRPPLYWTQTDTYLLAPISHRFPNSMTSSSEALIATASVVVEDVQGLSKLPPTASPDAHLTGLGVRSGFLLRVPDMGGQWEHSFTRPVISIEVIGSDPTAVASEAAGLIDRVRADLDARQRADQVPVRDRMTATLAPTAAQVFDMSGQPSRAAAITLLLGLWGTLLAAATADFLLPRLRARIRTRRHARHHPIATPALH